LSTPTLSRLIKGDALSLFFFSARPAMSVMAALLRLLFLFCHMSHIRPRVIFMLYSAPKPSRQTPLWAPRVRSILFIFAAMRFFMRSAASESPFDAPISAAAHAMMSSRLCFHV